MSNRVLSALLLASMASGSAGECTREWTCPSDWATDATGTADADNIADAVDFTAVSNIFRCMHSVPAVQWDHTLYTQSLKWAKHTGATMAHSPWQFGKENKFRPLDQGENMAVTATWQKTQPGVDSAHMWYTEMSKCGAEGEAIDDQCYGNTFYAPHFTATIWCTVDKIAYAQNDEKKLLFGQYDTPTSNPNNNNPTEWNDNIFHKDTKWTDCFDKVNKCDAFSLAHWDTLGQQCGYKQEYNSATSSMGIKYDNCTSYYASPTTLYDGRPNLANYALAPVAALASTILVMSALVMMGRFFYRKRVQQAEDSDDNLEPHE